MTIDSWLAAAQGDASGLWLLRDALAARLSRRPGEGRCGCGRADGRPLRRRFFASERRRRSLLGGSPGSDFIWAGGKLLDGWPANPDENEYGRVQDSKVDTLLIGGDLDFATPPQTATRELLPHLPNGRQVSYPGSATRTTSGPTSPGEPRPDQHLSRPRPGRHLALHPQPRRLEAEFPQTRIAKIVLATLLGFGALTILSLVALAFRVRSRGSLGRWSASRSARSTCWCSGSAAGSSVSWSR